MSMKQVLLAPSEMPTPEEHQAAGRFPLLASHKLDGNRCLIYKGKLLSRTMKPQPNENLPGYLAGICEYSKKFAWVFDGELYSHERPFSELQSILRSKDKPIPGDVNYHCFDGFPEPSWDDISGFGFEDRLEELKQRWTYSPITWANFQFVPEFKVSNVLILNTLYESSIREGYEGLILRDPSGMYRHGRATVKQGIIFKMKAFDTLDAVVVGYEQQVEVNGTAVRATNEMGRTARTHKAGDHHPVNCMGSLQVRDEKGRAFSIGWGKGWDYAKRTELWNQRDSLVGRWVEVRHMVAGEKDLPRMPQLVRFRDDKE